MNGCSIQGCDRAHYSRGWCAGHYNRWIRTGDAGSSPIGRSRGLCSLPGCGRPHQAVGLCRLHYARQRRTGNPGGAWITKAPGACSVCLRPDLDAINARLLLLEPRETTRSAFSVSLSVLRRHAEGCLGLVLNQGKQSCSVCEHPGLEDLERLVLCSRKSYAAAARRHGLTPAAVAHHFRNHLTEDYQAKLALGALRRLSAVQASTAS